MKENQEKAAMVVRVLEFIEDDPRGMEKLQAFLDEQGRASGQEAERRDRDGDACDR